MRRTPETDYVIAQYKHALQHNLPVEKVLQECADVLKCTVSAIKARLYRAGLKGNNSPMYYSDEQIVEAYKKHPSLSALAEELGCTFYTVRAALLRLGITPLSNRRTHERRSLYTGPATPRSLESKSERSLSQQFTGGLYDRSIRH